MAWLPRYNRMEKRTSSSLASEARIVRARTVSAPAQHEGVGNALRAAFNTESYGVPDEFAKLLARLG